MEPVLPAMDEVQEIYAQQIELYGGWEGIRDPGGLESAVAMPMATLDGQFLHSTIPCMAAAYLFHMCQDRPFVDGNKGTGANAAITFLLSNDWEPDFNDDELIDLVLSVASDTTSKSGHAEVFEARCHPASGPLPGC